MLNEDNKTYDGSLDVNLALMSGGLSQARENMMQMGGIHRERAGKISWLEVDRQVVDFFFRDLYEFERFLSSVQNPGITHVSHKINLALRKVFDRFGGDKDKFTMILFFDDLTFPPYNCSVEEEFYILYEGLIDNLDKLILYLEVELSGSTDAKLDTNVDNLLLLRDKMVELRESGTFTDHVRFAKGELKDRIAVIRKYFLGLEEQQSVH